MEFTVFRAGNWAVIDGVDDESDKGIKWVGEKGDYFIHVSQIAETGPADRANMYDFCVHIAPKAQFLEADIYAFNTALLFALDYFKIGFNPQISWKDTLKEQQKEIALKPDKHKIERFGEA